VAGGLKTSGVPHVVLALVAALLLRLPLAGAEPSARPVAVVDLHVDLPYQMSFKHFGFDAGSGQFRAVELVRAGVVGVVLPLFVPRDASPAGPRVRDFESSYQNVFGALGSTEPYRLPGCLPRGQGVRTWLSFEGIGPLADTPDALTSWAARGVRVLGPVHTFDNELASSSGEKRPASFGLTEKGRAFTRAALSAGMVLDVSHASDRATRELLTVAAEVGAPVVATHSNARALAAHPRNLADEELLTIARSGGVVGVNFHSPFVVRGRAAKLADVVAQVRYLARTMGAAHVAIGSDFEGDVRPAEGLADVLGYQRLAAALAAAGFGADEISAIFSRNALRVLCRGVGPAGVD
jgi:membrane dipeptidase